VQKSEKLKPGLLIQKNSNVNGFEPAASWEEFNSLNHEEEPVYQSMSS
jgi:hypothetical protein